MKDINFTTILKEALVGKQLKVRVYSHNIIQPYLVWKKKSANVTDAQFESGSLKYRMPVNRTKVIGYHEKFEIFTISNVWITTDFDMGGGGSTLHLSCKDGGREFNLEFTDKLECIGDNLYMIKQE